MPYALRNALAFTLLPFCLMVGACGRHGRNETKNTSGGEVSSPASTGAYNAAPTTTSSAPAPEHHSKMKGALIGAAVGHAAGKHGMAGAAAGAMIQHKKNKHNR